MKKENEQSVEQKIHQEVYSAQDVILDHAYQELTRDEIFSQQDQNRLNELSEIGFANSESVKKFKQKDSRKSNAVMKKNMIEYFTQKYFHKFIDDETVQSICEKYGLVLARVHRFTGEIPVKNQDEIIKFKVQRKDVDPLMPESVYLSHVLSGLGYFPTLQFHPSTFHSFEENIQQREKRAEERRKRAEERLKRERKIMYREEKERYNKLVQEQENWESGIELKIIAPEHMILTNNTEKVGHEIREIPIKDPIVLQPVMFKSLKGYLIVTSWGDEASDENVINPDSN